MVPPICRVSKAKYDPTVKSKNYKTAAYEWCAVERSSFLACRMLFQKIYDSY